MSIFLWVLVSLIGNYLEQKPDHFYIIFSFCKPWIHLGQYLNPVLFYFSTALQTLRADLSSWSWTRRQWQQGTELCWWAGKGCRCADSFQRPRRPAASDSCLVWSYSNTWRRLVMLCWATRGKRWPASPQSRITHLNAVSSAFSACQPQNRRGKHLYKYTQGSSQ